jgi:hypothetical protein
MPEAVKTYTMKEIIVILLFLVFMVSAFGITA